MSFLRVLVLLVAVIVCSSAQVCQAPGGQIDTFQKGMCNCWSGYAPSNTDGVDCKVHPKCAPAMPDALDTAHGNAPKRPSTYFAYDSLEIVQQIPIVANRKATWIQFVVPTGLPDAGTFGAKTCQYPGPLWNKTINGLDCIEEYRASLPWSQNGMCGFAKDTAKSANTTNVYSSVLFTTVVETYTTGTTSYERLSTTSYKVSVSFISQKTFTSGTFSVGITDPTSAGVLTKYIVSDSVYDATTGATVIELVTTASWPYKLAQDSASLAAAFVNVVPSISGIAVAFTNKPDALLPCDATSRSPCSQRWRVAITSTGSCVDNLQGVYNFVEPLLCRDNITNGAAGNCPTGVTTIPLSITVHTTHLCDTTPVDTSSANSFALTAHSDADHSISANQFQVGDKIYWTFEIVNPLVSIKSVAFNSIQMALDSGPSDILFSSAIGGISPTGVAVDLQVQSISGTIPAGTTGTLSFSYDLLRSQLPNTVGTLQSNNLMVQIATSVVVDIQYYGNKKKRAVAMDLTSMDVKSAGSDTRSIRVFATDIMTTNNEEAEAETDSASFIRGSLFVIAAAFAFCLL
jgi:hypothetical protein